MSRNYRRHNNKVPMRALSPWLIMAILALIGGMTWVYFKNQQQTRGNEIKALERELAALNTENEALRPKIAELSSRKALQIRLNEGFVKMVPITQAAIVQVALQQNNASSSDEIRTVSNNAGVAR